MVERGERDLGPKGSARAGGALHLLTEDKAVWRYIRVDFICASCSLLCLFHSLPLSSLFPP